MTKHDAWMDDENRLEADGAPFLAIALASGRWALMTSMFEPLGWATAPTKEAAAEALSDLSDLWRALKAQGTITQ